ATGRWTVQADVGNVLGVKCLNGLTFFPVEDRHVWQDAAILQDNVHVLRTHPGFRKCRELFLPLFSKVDSHWSLLRYNIWLRNAMIASAVHKDDFHAAVRLAMGRLNDTGLQRRGRG